MKVFVACSYLNTEDNNWKRQIDRGASFLVRRLKPYYCDTYYKLEQAWIRDAFGHADF